MKLEEFCKSLEINYEENISRFAGNENIYIKFLKRFIEDSTYDNLKQAYSQKLYEDIEKNAHMLKGLAANLGINRIFSLSNDIVQSVRQKEFNKIDNLYNKLAKEYELTIQMIRNID